jgi:phthalate 4,5-cis-dihydrodiol dehydrogenase
MGERRLGVGVVGLGVGAAHILRHLQAAPYTELCAGADIDPQARERFRAVFPEAKVYATLDQLAADPDVEAVWVATPSRLHAQHTIALANSGKHVAVQKPMALSLDEAAAMIDAADRNNVILLAGNSQSFATPVRMMRQLVRSGQLGSLCAINVFSYHDWLLKARKPEDLDVAEGGGVVYRAAPHQIDTIRLIGGGLLKTVRGTHAKWMAERAAPGYSAAYAEFTDGTPAVLIQNAYGYFVTEEMMPWVPSGEQFAWASQRVAQRGAIRRMLRDGTRDEAAEYQARSVGGSMDSGAPAPGRSREWATDLGIVVVSCERGDIRQSPRGLYVYTDDGIREISLPSGSAWEAEIREMYEAIVTRGKAFHSGRWGMATLEVALGIVESARTHRQVTLRHQVQLDQEYDAVYSVHPTGEAQVV